MSETQQTSDIASLEARLNAVSESIAATGTLLSTMTKVLQNHQARLLEIEGRVPDDPSLNQPLQTAVWRITMQSPQTDVLYVASVTLDKPINILLTDNEWLFLETFGRQNTAADAVLISAIPMQ